MSYSSSPSSTCSFKWHDGASGPYFLHIEGLPTRYTWQDLKDLIREKAARKGVWAVMTDDEERLRGWAPGTGYARLARKDEAERLYQYLTQNLVEDRMLRVHLFDISIDQASFRVCNCNMGRRPHPMHSAREGAWIQQMVTELGWQHNMPTSPPIQPRLGYAMSPSNTFMTPQGSTAVQPGPATQERLTPQQLRLMNDMVAMGLDSRYPEQRAYYRQRIAPAPIASMATSAYAGNSAGISVNVGNGAVQTESRGVFVSQLSYDATERDIKEHFRKAGNVIRVTISRDATTQKSKGNCTVHYNTAAEAENAVDKFNREVFMERELTVRLDRNKVPVDTPSAIPVGQPSRSSGRSGPTIVNGSQVR